MADPLVEIMAEAADEITAEGVAYWSGRALAAERALDEFVADPEQLAGLRTAVRELRTNLDACRKNRVTLKTRAKEYRRLIRRLGGDPAEVSTREPFMGSSASNRRA